MKDSTKRLKGSPFRDAVKTWHKTLGKGLYLCDIDMALIVFKVGGVPVHSCDAVVAVMDAKGPRDRNLSDTHQQCYNWFIERDVPVYLVTPLKYTKTYCKSCHKYDVVIDASTDVMIRKYPDGRAIILTRDEYKKFEKLLRTRGDADSFLCWLREIKG